MKQLQSLYDDLTTRLPDRPQPNCRKAFDILQKKGFPTKKWENWRFTDLSQLHKQNWRLSSSTDNPTDVLINDDLKLLSPYSVIFINGHYQPELSSLPSSVDILTLADYFKKYTSSTLYNESVDDNPYYLLNTALSDSGIAVIIPSDEKPDHPIVIHYLKTELSDPLMFQPRTIIHSGQGSKATIIENHHSDDTAKYFSNNVTEISVDNDGDLTYISLQNESKHAYDIHSIYTSQKANSNLTTGIFNFNGLLSRKQIQAELKGEGANLNLFGLNAAHLNQLLDVHSVVKHQKPNCTSDQLFKYILKDQSKGVFKGKVIVEEDAQKTDARQSNKSLILSDHARMNSDPQLEIYTDDVKCSHGSTTGSLDEEAIFYLQSRGLDKPSAKMLLIDGFAKEVIQNIPDQQIKKYILNKLNYSQ